jgi:hypothetical protein
VTLGHQWLVDEGSRRLPDARCHSERRQWRLHQGKWFWLPSTAPPPLAADVQNELTESTLATARSLITSPVEAASGAARSVIDATNGQLVIERQVEAGAPPPSTI